MAGKKIKTAAAADKNDQTEQKFSKEQLVVSVRYRNRKDLVSALLDDGKVYTVTEVDQMIEMFMKGQVK